MDNHITLAEKTLVDFGTSKIEGYLLPSSLWTKSNKFGVSKTQAVILAYPDYDRSQAAKRYIQVAASKQAQSIAPQGFAVHPKLKVRGVNEKADLLPVDQLVPFLKVCKKLGSQTADDLLDNLAGLSLQQIFSDAFKLKFDEESRQNWLKAREGSKQAFWTLGDATKSYLDLHPEKTENYRKFVYPNCQDALNRGLFGMSASQIRKELNVSDLLRDHYGETALRRLDLVQPLAAARIINEDMEPLESVKAALAMFAFEEIDYKE